MKFYVVSFEDEKWVKTFSQKRNAIRFAKKFGGMVQYGNNSQGWIDVQL
jgi:hypothetical protein